MIRDIKWERVYEVIVINIGTFSENNRKKCRVNFNWIYDNSNQCHNKDIDLYFRSTSLVLVLSASRSRNCRKPTAGQLSTRRNQFSLNAKLRNYHSIIEFHFQYLPRNVLLSFNLNIRCNFRYIYVYTYIHTHCNDLFYRLMKVNMRNECLLCYVVKCGIFNICAWDGSIKGIKIVIRT